MHHFAYRDGQLFAEDVDVAALAQKVGTPFYLYSEATLRRHVSVFRDAFADVDALIAYSVKANSNIAVLKILCSEGAGADVVSGGELKRALHAGIDPQKIVYSGVAKTDEEIAAAVEAGIRQFNVESEPELDHINSIATARGEKAPIAFRINPDVAAGGHEKISTGKAEDKFGVSWRRARALYEKASALPGIRVCGVDVHIGSQISDLAPFETAFNRVGELIRELRADGCTIDSLDLGGGLGIPYSADETPPHPDQYAELIKRITRPLDVRLIFEPGRMIAGNSGILISKVTYVKEGDDRRFLIIDAGMNDLMRPALYGAVHEIWPVAKKANVENATYDVVGPICESSDRFAASYEIQTCEEGDFIALMSAGAYGAVQSSQYNSRSLTPEVLVKDDQVALIRERQTFEQLIANEKTPAWLKK